MMLLSLSSLRLRKFLFSLTVFFGFASVCCFAQPIFFAVKSTPYDRQMARVRPVLTRVASHPTGGIPIATVNEWMDQLREIPYRYSRQWQTPSEVNTARAADCKGKAVTLYKIMQAMGATNVRLVIGRRRVHDWRTHAWLQWETADGNYLLDPTFQRMAARDMQDRFSYVPLYGYEGERKYRAFDVTLITQN
jgi:hypothetical protein